MHELDAGIAKWRQTMAEQIGSDEKVLDELEGHLHEEIDRLLRCGKTPAEAMSIAIAKMGPPQALAGQFAKLNMPWWPIYFTVGSAALVSTALLAMIVLTTGNPLLRIHAGAVSAGYISTYAIGVLSLCWAIRTLFGELPIGQRSATVRALVWMSAVALASTLVAMLTGAVWANKHLGHYWGWGPREIGALLVVTWQAVLLGLLWRSPMKHRWLMSWGMLGKVTIIFAWFVANTVALQGVPRTQYVALTVLTAHVGIYVLLVVWLITISVSRNRRLSPT